MSAGAGCGDFTASVASISARVGERWVPLEVRAALGPIEVLAAFDIDGDGSPELLVKEYGLDLLVLSKRGGAYGIAAERRTPNFDCDC